MPTTFREHFGATQTVQRIAQPGLRPAARAIARAIPQYVPVHHGVMRRTYRPTVVDTDDSVRVHTGSPFWHWLEYGTRFNPAYRPVERAVRSLGLRFDTR